MALRIPFTGVRSGEFITASSSGSQNKGSVLQIRGLYPPSKAAIATLDDTTVRDTFNNLPFFNELTVKERWNWLNENATSNSDLYLDGVPDLEVKFINLGGTAFYGSKTNFDAETVDQFLKGNPEDLEGYWPISEIMAMARGKPGSKGLKGRHTLVFRPGNWVLQEAEAKQTIFDGLIYDLSAQFFATATMEELPGNYFRVFKSEASNPLVPDFALRVDTTRKEPLTWDILTRLAGEDYVEDMNRIKPFIEWFPPALHKSLLQKIIRTRCTQVEYADQTFESGAALLATLSLLMLHPGSFVPNIQTFVSGMESAAKRLAVSICEDAYVEDKNAIAVLFASALIAKHDRKWQPPDELIVEWFKTALLAQRDPRMYDYRHRTWNGTLPEWDEMVLSYMLLRELKSFESDIKMMGSIAELGSTYRKPVQDRILMDPMPLIHCVDQHTFTEIGHFFQYSDLGTLLAPEYGKLFNQIWDVSSGVNPRDGHYRDWKSTPQFRAVREAQRLTWISKIQSPEERQPRDEIKGESYKFKYNLHRSWLAGMIGLIEVKLGNTSCYVVLRTDDIRQLTAVKRPSRDKKSATELTPEEKEQAVEKAKQILRAGVKLQVPDTLPQFKGAIAYLYSDSADSEEEYYLALNRSKVMEAWSDLTQLEYDLPIHPEGELSMEAALTYQGNGIMKGADDKLRQILEQTDVKVLRRLATYLRGSKSKILLHKIGRDGDGVDFTVLPEDTGVNNFLCSLCCLYPAALERSDMGFNVRNGPLLWSLKTTIRQYLSNLSETDQEEIWAPIEGDGRPLWEHQHDSVEMMKERLIDGYGGNEIWIDVGLGKTLIFEHLLKWLIDTGRMPPHCVYTMPPSAVNSVTREFDNFGIPYQQIDMRLTNKQGIKTLTPGIVNIVLHDHMRMNGMDQQLKELAPQMLFIVDEFHKTLAKTIRSSIALEVVRLSRYFIAMSGTIIKDQNPQDLIEWLQEIVEFEVTEKNYWVAIGALISKKVALNINIDREVIEAPLLDEKAYYQTVPKGLGGTAIHLNIKEALRYSMDAMTVEIINQIKLYLSYNERVFVVAKDTVHQRQIHDSLFEDGTLSSNREIHLIDRNNPITLDPSDAKTPIRVVITTIQHAEGYTLSLIRIGITGVYFSNQATRDQLLGRIVRISQQSSEVRWITVHAGLLSYIFKRYEAARSIAEAMKGFAEDVNLNVEDIRKSLSLA